jgi:hypothetical protein
MEPGIERANSARVTPKLSQHNIPHPGPIIYREKRVIIFVSRPSESPPSQKEDALLGGITSTSPFLRAPSLPLSFVPCPGITSNSTINNSPASCYIIPGKAHYLR